LLLLLLCFSFYSSSPFNEQRLGCFMLAAVGKGDAKELAELIRQDPGFDVNMDQDEDGWTLLHYACLDSLRSAVIPLLLAYPDIDVNVKGGDGWTPFYFACSDGNPTCVREMLKDSRVEANEPTHDGVTPLWRVAWFGRIDFIKWWIASGREMDLGEPGDVDKTDAIEVAKAREKMEVVNLLERFKGDAAQTRHAIRVGLGFLDDLAAEMFALVIFVLDGLVQINDTTLSPAARYFSIATQLPLELQMVLCHRVVRSAKEIIPGKESEATFKRLAQRHKEGEEGHTGLVAASL